LHQQVDPELREPIWSQVLGVLPLDRQLGKILTQMQHVGAVYLRPFEARREVEEPGTAGVVYHRRSGRTLASYKHVEAVPVLPIDGSRQVMRRPPGLPRGADGWTPPAPYEIALGITEINSRLFPEPKKSFR